MKIVEIKRLFKNNAAGSIIIFIASIILVYLLGSIYFARHFSFNTTLNGVNVSLKSNIEAEGIIKGNINAYKLKLIERKGEAEEIVGQDIELKYNEAVHIPKVSWLQNAFRWICSFFKKQEYYIDELFVYDKDKLKNKINGLGCLNNPVTEPRNVSFKYVNGMYEVVEEVYGNKVNRDKLTDAVERSILRGENKLDLNDKLCYENPRYTSKSDKTFETIEQLNKYISASITYIFGNEKEVLNKDIINQWLSVDDNLDVILNEIAVMKYVRALGKKYDTVGAARKFKTSVGKTVEVKGGLYGWKIDHAAETNALLKNLRQGQVIEKDPLYAQTTVSRGGDEIGNTYVEINITRQHMWFYKNGRLITQGSVVTGNPNRGYSTVVGTYMLNYKDNGATLRGPGYEAEVTYWMPFFGNIGIHDATWRYSFGGQIYKRNGSHGCVNAPLYLAKAIFENIEEGTPIVCYEEEEKS
jgi:lipoprotein-anchoring transpeptidase ErfK/SrfK